MNWNIFWIGFLPNFISEIIAGGIIGVLFSLWLARKIGNELNNDERMVDKLFEEKERTETTLLYLETIQRSVRKLLLFIDYCLLERLDYKNFEIGNPLYFREPYWEAIKLSGELPRYINLNHVDLMCTFFSNLDIADLQRIKIQLRIDDAKNLTDAGYIIPEEIKEKIAKEIDLFKEILLIMKEQGEELLNVFDIYMPLYLRQLEKWSNNLHR